jgi:O-acetyl-ADP-ribose deacetylase (regulator of RNase III)
VTTPAGQTSRGRTSSYQIGNRTFQVTFGNLSEVSADALVSSDDSYLSMGGGVSAALSNAGGGQVGIDARKHIPLALGDVVVTTAGSLPAKYIFHGVTIDFDQMTRPDADCVSRIVARCLDLAETLRLHHVAFPALGTGLGGFPFELAAEAMTRAIADFLAREPRYLAKVTLVLYARAGVSPSELDLFYERAAGLATQWTDSRRLHQLVDELEALLARTDSGTLRERAQQLRRDVSQAEASLANTAGLAAPDAVDQASPLRPASDEAGALADQSAAVVDWEDIKARETILQLRLQSLRTQHNIIIGNRNQLEERKAKYGPHAVPLEVENALADILVEITSKEDEIRTIKSELIQLGSARLPHR